MLSLPLFLSTVGTREYGTWLIYIALPTYLAFVDLGVSTVAATQATSYVARGQFSSARSLMRGVFLLTTASSTLLFGAVVLMAEPLSALLPSGDTGRARPGLLVLVTGFTLLVLLTGCIEGTLRAAGFYPSTVAAVAALRLLELGATGAGLLLFGTLEAAATALIIARVAGMLALVTLLRIRSCQMSLGFRGASVREVLPLLASGLTYLAFPLGNAVSLQGMTLIVAAKLGVTEVVQLAALRTLSGFIRQATTAVNLGSLPELTRFMALGEAGLLVSLRKQALRLNFAVTLCAGSLLILAGPFLISRWTRGDLEIDRLLVAAFVVTVAADVPWLTSSNILVAANKHQALACGYVATAVFAVLLAFLLVGPLGLFSVPITLLLIDVVLTRPAGRAADRLISARVPVEAS